jgi:predicted DNA-binding WGR domain protein
MFLFLQTREERKMEAIMKAFERLEKAEQRRQETLAKQQRQRGSVEAHDDDSEQHETEIIRRPKG